MGGLSRRIGAWTLGTLAGLGLSACGGGSADNSSSANPALSQAAALGEQLFHDTGMSASGQQACSTCHNPKLAYTDGNQVSLGGLQMNLPGFRNAPSLTYASFTPAFFFASDGTPTGGFFRDGRATSLATQAQQPLVTSYEMANADSAAVLVLLQTRPYAAAFQALYGATALTDPTTALQDIGLAIQAYEQEDASFHPFNSKFDAYQSGKTQLSSQELNGLALFNNPTAGNCAACHPSVSGDGKTPPLFTDFTYDNVGVPRNTNLAANANNTTLTYVPQNGTDGVYNYYDMGLCGPFRTADSENPITNNVSGFCGQFKVPTLRNIALTAPYFHNGEFASLQNALSFYVTRDTNPENWYPTQPDGSVTKFNDLPAAYGGMFVVNWEVVGSDYGYLGNVNNVEIPYNRLIGEQPALSSSQLVDVIAFLCTLTDGFDPSNASGYVLPAQCPQSQSGS